MKPTVAEAVLSEEEFDELFDRKVELEPIEVEDPPETPDAAEAVKSDSSFVRKHLYHLIQKGNFVLDEAINAARADPHPRSFEVISTIIRSITECSRELRLASQESYSTQKKIETDKIKETGETGGDGKKKAVGTLDEILRAAEKKVG